MLTLLFLLIYMTYDQYCYSVKCGSYYSIDYEYYELFDDQKSSDSNSFSSESTVTPENWQYHIPSISEDDFFLYNNLIIAGLFLLLLFYFVFKYCLNKIKLLFNRISRFLLKVYVNLYKKLLNIIIFSIILVFIKLRYFP